MNPYRGLPLSDLYKLKKETIAKCREEKAKRNRGAVIKLRKDIEQIKGSIEREINKRGDIEISPERKQILEIKQENYQEQRSRFGFEMTSHALHRYRLRFNPQITMEMLFEKLLQTDLPKYVQIFPTGQFPLSDDCVAVLKHKRIITFKNPNQNM